MANHQPERVADINRLEVGHNVYARKITTKSGRPVLDGKQLKERTVSRIIEVGGKVVLIESKGKSAGARIFIHSKNALEISKGDEDNTVVVPMNLIVLEMHGKYFYMDKEGNNSIELTGEEMAEAMLLTTITSPAPSVPTIPIPATNPLELKLPAHLRPTTNNLQAFHMGTVTGAYINILEANQRMSESLKSKERTEAFNAEAKMFAAQEKMFTAQSKKDVDALNLARHNAGPHY
ncbi:hypothetical protein T492DRAFT_1090180 [Pavlovales sp. CCMP2436]|nr:hypothetical protein T492DRAFT_1090180 [Pavlovales sp. CCMP2436]